MTDGAVQLIQEQLRKVRARSCEIERILQRLAEIQRRVSSEYIKYRRAEENLNKSLRRLRDHPG